MPELCEVKAVIATVANPTSKRDGGIVAEGWYKRDGDVLTMTDRDGIPLRDDNTGERVTVRLSPGEDEKMVARKLTMKRYRAARGDDLGDFNRRIDYGPSRVV
jgi:hypothetical protein